MSSVADREFSCTESEYRRHAVHCALESIRTKTSDDSELYFKISVLWLKLSELANKLEAGSAVRNTRNLVG